MMQYRKMLLFIAVVICLLSFGKAYACTNISAPLEINVRSFDIYDVVSWDEIKHRMFVTSEGNELPPYRNIYWVNDEEFALYEKEKPDFVILWLRFEVSVNEGNIWLNQMIFSERENTRMCCRMYSNIFLTGAGYCDFLQEDEKVKDSLFIAICADDFFSSEKKEESIFDSSSFFCNVEYTTYEGMSKNSKVKVEFDKVTYQRMYCFNGLTFCAFDIEVLDVGKSFSSQIRAVREAWSTLPESVYSDLQIHPEKYKLVRLYVHGNKNMSWNAYQLKYITYGRSDCVWLKKWNQSSGDMVFAYDADDVLVNGGFDREIMLLINCENIDLPVDEFVRTLEIYVSFSTEIIGDDGGITLSGPTFYEQVCMQKH